MYDAGGGDLHQSVDGEGGVLAVGKASDHAAEFTTLVGDAHVDVRDLMVVVDLGSLSGKRIADLGAVEEHDIVLEAEGKGLTTVHDGGDGDVGQSEKDTALADASGIEVLGSDGEFGGGIAFAHFLEDTAAVSGKAVVLGKEILESHTVRS